MNLITHDLQIMGQPGGRGDWGIKCITGKARYTKKTKYREASTYTIPKSGLPSSNYHNKIIHAVCKTP
jgi:hypothetical protein